MYDNQLTQLYIRLGERKQQILTLLCDGLSNGEIADRLFIASSVVAGHLTDIYGEIGNLPPFAHRQIIRPVAIAIFAPFFERHPNLRATIRTS